MVAIVLVARNCAERSSSELWRPNFGMFWVVLAVLFFTLRIRVGEQTRKCHIYILIIIIIFIICLLHFRVFKFLVVLLTLVFLCDFADV